MNELRGTISEVRSQNHMSLVTIDVQGNAMRSIVLDSPATADYLQEGNKVSVLFKETEVILAIPGAHHISLQNQLLCTVTGIEKGKLLGKVFMNFEGNSITSIVTARAVDQLELASGNEIMALIKTNEVMLAP
ncbi:MAG: tobe domain protein [Bacteroidetes bacterium]|nr:MAG: tobe domain protein [Bacteroidota bacterium]